MDSERSGTTTLSRRSCPASAPTRRSILTMFASKFDVDPEGLLLLRSTVRREVDKLRATHALHKDDLTGNLSPEQLDSFSSAKAWDDDDTREMPPPPPPPRTVDLPSFGIRVSADPTDDDDDDDDRDEVFARSPSGRVDWRAPGQPVDGASSVRLAPVREEGDDSGDEDDLPAEYPDRLSKDLGRLVVQEGRSLHCFNASSSIFVAAMALPGAVSLQKLVRLLRSKKLADVRH